MWLKCVLLNVLFSAEHTSPQQDTLTSTPLELPVKAPQSAVQVPPAPVGQRSQAGAAAPRPTSTTAGSQNPPDLLEQRKGKKRYILGLLMGHFHKDVHYQNLCCV